MGLATRMRDAILTGDERRRSGRVQSAGRKPRPIGTRAGSP